ncbi:DUF4365 domain-containing protein [Chitinophaga sp.]|uniref:DUF4365 domain-containing protein n=1 Tax=Chitinophaga sp. TaxID=1869181 RepID=UPI002F936355
MQQDLPQNHRNHVLARKSVSYFNRCLPEEFIAEEPKNDYGIDLNVSISINGQVTGLNFSVQIKSTERAEHERYAKPLLERYTLNYLKTRLEPTMLVMYDAEADEAYWSWLSDFDIDYAKLKETRTFSIPKSRKLSEWNKDEIINHVQQIFNAKNYLSEVDVRAIDSEDELRAWAAYRQHDYEQSAYLFRKLMDQTDQRYGVHQALAWSYYHLFRYKEALYTINYLIDIEETRESLIIKGCILAEYGAADNDKGKVLQARNIFKEHLDIDDNALMLYNYGNTFYSLGEYEAATEQFLRSLDKDPIQPQCLKNLGTSYYHLDLHEKELECYDRALDIDPDLPQALFSKGVTLAQVYKKYAEALELFNKVLSYRNDLIQQYVNGLYWVARCYEELDNLEMAWKWVNKGLNYEGNNFYLLQFKTDLLGRHWKKDDTWRKRSIEFFNYRIELNQDNLSIYYLIGIYDYDMRQAVDFLKDKLVLYKSIDVDDLEQLRVDLKDIKDTLIYVPYYAQFRSVYILQRYVDHLISPHYSISSQFWDLLDVVFCIAFSRAVHTAKSSTDVVDLGKALYDIVNTFMPLMVNFLLPEQDYEHEAVAEIIIVGIPGFLDLIHREIGAQSGYITVNLGLRTIDPDEYFTEEGQKQLIDGVTAQFLVCLCGPDE